MSSDQNATGPPPSLEKAKQLLGRGSFSDALSMFTELAEREPDSARAQMGVATAHARLGEWTQVQAITRNVAASFPGNAYAKELFAEACFELDDGAEEVLRDLTTTLPESPAGPRGLARIASRKNRWAEALEWWQEALSRSPGNINFRMRCAECLGRTGNQQAALAGYETLATEMESDPAYWASRARTEMALGLVDSAVVSVDAGLSRAPSNRQLMTLHVRGLMASAAEWPAAIEAAERLHHEHPSVEAASLVFQTLRGSGDTGGAVRFGGGVLRDVEYQAGLATNVARLAAQIGRFDVARKVVERASKADDHAAMHTIEAVVAVEQEHWSAALDHWRQVLQIRPSYEAKVGVADALVGCRRFDEAFIAYESAKAEDPDETRAFIGQMQLEARRFELDHAADLAREALAKFADDPAVVHAAVDALSVAGLREEAEQILTTSQEIDEYQQLASRSEWHRRCYEYDETVDIRTQLAKDTSLPVGMRESSLISAAGALVRMQPGAGALTEYLQMFEHFDADRIRLAEARIELLVAAGLMAEALVAIDQIVPEYHNRAGVARLLAWAATQRGDHDGAAKHGAIAAEAIYKPQLHAPIENFSSFDELATINDGEIVAIVVGRNEALRIGDFFRHHRALGVDRFIFVDNGSDDGTLDWIDSSDTIVMHTSDDYVAAGMGMRWVNEIISQITTRNWCLFLDADEHLVYPRSESLGIRALCDYLDRQGFNAVRGFMLDMHAETYADQLRVAPGDELLATCPYFTNTYRFQNLVESPYQSIRGGVRPDLLGIKYREQTKTPLVRSDSGVQFTLSSHETTPSKIADVSTVLLHYKFLGDSLERAADETRWTSYAYFANRERQQSSAITDRDAFSYRSPNMIRYQGSEQLVDLGLMQAGSFGGGQNDPS